MARAGALAGAGSGAEFQKQDRRQERATMGRFAIMAGAGPGAVGLRSRMMTGRERRLSGRSRHRCLRTCRIWAPPMGTYIIIAASGATAGAEGQDLDGLGWRCLKGLRTEIGAGPWASTFLGLCEPGARPSEL